MKGMGCERIGGVFWIWEWNLKGLGYERIGILASQGPGHSIGYSKAKHNRLFNRQSITFEQPIELP